MNSRDELKRVNGYLREEFPGQLDSIRELETEIQSPFDKCLTMGELEGIGVPTEEIKRLLAYQI